MKKTISFFETKSKKKSFINNNDLKIYCCGPTVYRKAHIGNLRCYITLDLLTRTLKYFGISFKSIVNITDIGHLDENDNDKVFSIGKNFKEKCLENFNHFVDDLKKLNIQLPDKFCWATDYVKEQLEIIDQIYKTGLATIEDDGVYLNVKKCKFDENFLLANVSSMLKTEEGSKKASFALWRKSEDGLFESKYGRGYPGWHIECLAIIIKELGNQIDIHLGGFDHISVHHNNEIMQSYILGIKELSKNWMHTNTINIDGKKMSKSKNNVILLSEIHQNKFDYFDFKFFVLLSNFRKKIDFSWLGLRETSNIKKKLIRALAINIKLDIEEDKECVEKLEEKISKLDSPGFIKSNIEMLKQHKKVGEFALKIYEEVLGLNISKCVDSIVKILDEDKENINHLMEERKKAKLDRDWVQSDCIRLKIENMGYELHDFKYQTIILRK